MEQIYKVTVIMVLSMIGFIALFELFFLDYMIPSDYSESLLMQKEPFRPLIVMGCSMLAFGFLSLGTYYGNVFYTVISRARDLIELPQDDEATGVNAKKSKVISDVCTN